MLIVNPVLNAIPNGTDCLPRGCIRTGIRSFRVLVLCLFLALGCCGVLYAASPPAYEKAKTDMDRLIRDARKSQWRAPWVELAADFMDVYEAEKKWDNRSAALYRSALALDELARRSARRKDARAADARYLLLVERHKSSVLADDALYKAARLRVEFGDDVDGALQLLQRIQSSYTSGDMAKDARRYTATLRSRENEEKKTASSEKVKPSARPAKSDTSGKSGAPAKSAKSARTASAGKPFTRPVRTVLIDAGHGGKDPGTRHNGIVERTITLDLARRVGAILAAHGLTVRYTRFSNTWLTLDERTDKIRTQKADAFLSIHVNANPSEAIHGFETYYLDIARTSEASRLAAVENAMAGRSRDKMPAARLLGIQNQESRQFARSVHRNTLSEVKKKGYGIRDGGIKTAPFQVLRKSGVPGILIEVGYCTNLKEAEMLDSPVYRAALARGVANGILEYAKD